MTTMSPELLRILTIDYHYSFMRVEFPDHDLGDEDRRWSGWVRERMPWTPHRCTRRQDYAFSNPPRPKKSP